MANNTGSYHRAIGGLDELINMFASAVIVTLLSYSATYISIP